MVGSAFKGKLMIYQGKETSLGREFLLSPQAEAVRKVAESLYPQYLSDCVSEGKEISPVAVPVLDDEFMMSRAARWARILAESTFAEYVMEKKKVEHTIVFFGSARIHPPGENSSPQAEALSHYYEECRELSYKITKWSLSKGNEEHPQPFVVTTGGGPAIMEAGNRGAHDAGGKTIGLNIALPMEEKPNPYIPQDYNFYFHYFFTRKFHFSYRAKFLVAFPGGFGTLDELFEILTLIQTRKINRPCGILLYGKDFWEKCVNFDHLVESGVISAKDLDLFKIVDDVDTAFKLITPKLETYL